MSFIQDMLPDFQDIVDSEGINGVISRLTEDYRLSNLDVFELLTRDTNPDISQAVGLDDEARNFLNLDIVSTLLGSGVGPNTLEQMRMLPEYPQNPAALNAFMRQFGNTLLPRSTRPVGIASVGLTQASKALRYLAARSTISHRSTIRSGLMSAAAGLDTIAAYGGGYITDGIAASQIWDGIQAVWSWWSSQTKEQKAEATDADRQLLQVVKTVEGLIRNADIVDKDSEMVVKLAAALGTGLGTGNRSQITGVAREMLHKEYENHVLSVLKRQLQDVLNERLPLIEYSAMGAIERATRKAGSKTLSGYPGSTIGI